MGKRDTFIGRNKVVDIVLEETQRGTLLLILKKEKRPEYIKKTQYSTITTNK